MGYRDGYVMRTINDLVRVVTRLVLGKSDIGYDFPEDEGKYMDLDRVYEGPKGLVDEGNINDTENLLTDELDTDSLDCLEMALTFCMYSDQPKDDKLHTVNYSQEETVDEVDSVCAEYGISGFEYFVDTTVV